MSTIIKKIEIHRFRSISDVSIDTQKITVFSGLNNSGKSNVLRALNLFFKGHSSFGQKYDFERDYNKAFTGRAGGKRAIKIILHFDGQGTGALSDSFSISKTFQMGIDQPEIEYQSKNEKTQRSIAKKDGNITRQFTRFLNKIEYFYIPAVRDREFVRSLFLHFEKLIEHDSGNDFKQKMGDLSKVLKKYSSDVSSDFESFIGLPTQAELSSKITDILGTVEINVKTGIKVLRKTRGGSKEDTYVNLFSSGDGILMSYLAYFLAHVCKTISNKKFIWGFEEPENSLEYSKVQKLANDFYNNFKKNAQLFITTHSPAFINLKDKDDVAFYRVYIKPDDEKQVSEIRTLDSIEKRQRSLFDDQEIESNEYRKLQEELFLVEMSAEMESAVEKVRKHEKELLDSKKQFEKKHKALLDTRPEKILICEDSSSESIKLWEKLLKMFTVNDVKVITSNGCTWNFVENGIRHQQSLDSTYNPKVFRQIDLDGLTDKQVQAIEQKCYSTVNGFSYKYKFLPVNELEHFSVLADEEKFSDAFWEKNENEIVKYFERTAESKLRACDKKFNYENQNFRGSGGTYLSIIQNMREKAFRDWKKYFPGKEICRKIQDYNPIKRLSKMSMEGLPKELCSYMQDIKIFFES